MDYVFDILKAHGEPGMYVPVSLWPFFLSGSNTLLCSGRELIHSLVCCIYRQLSTMVKTSGFTVLQCNEYLNQLNRLNCAKRIKDKKVLNNRVGALCKTCASQQQPKRYTLSFLHNFHNPGVSVRGCEEKMNAAQHAGVKWRGGGGGGIGEI
jgi:hypothetical protein